MIFVTPYSCMSTAELAQEYATVLDEYDQLKAQGLNQMKCRTCSNTGTADISGI